MQLFTTITTIENRTRVLCAFRDKYAHILPQGSPFPVSSETLIVPQVGYVYPDLELVGKAFGRTGWRAQVSDRPRSLDLQKTVDGVLVTLWYAAPNETLETDRTKTLTVDPAIFTK